MGSPGDQDAGRRRYAGGLDPAAGYAYGANPGSSKHRAFYNYPKQARIVGPPPPPLRRGYATASPAKAPWGARAEFLGGGGTKCFLV